MMFALSNCPAGGCGDAWDLPLASLIAIVLLLAYLGALAVVRARLTDRDAARRRQNRGAS